MNFKIDTLISISTASEWMRLSNMITLSEYLSRLSFCRRYIYQVLILFYLLFFPSFSFAFSLSIVSKNSICMVMNKVVDYKELIPVEMEEDFKTKYYYVCSEDLVSKIKDEYFTRNSYDSAIKMSVSKADAIVGLDDLGNVHYFISKRTFDLFLNDNNK